eukprot:8516978-Alexandrium_andersonii.AAC.1
MLFGEDTPPRVQAPRARRLPKARVRATPVGHRLPHVPKRRIEHALSRLGVPGTPPPPPEDRPAV